MVPIETLLREREEMQQHQASQQATIETLSGTVENLRAYILRLEEYIRNDRRKQFGPSSEKLADAHPNLFNEAEAESADPAAEDETQAAAPAETETTPRQRKPRKPFRIPPGLPRVEIIHDLPESEKVCPKDGTPLKHMDDEISEQLDIIPAQVQVLRHVRRTYACPCCEQHVATATKPKAPIEKGLASPRLLATIATQKYVDGLPLYRQGEVFKRMGIELDRSTQANWMIKAGELIQPLINLIHERMLEEPFLHMDETRLQVLKEDGRKAQAQSYMWVMRSTGYPAVLYRYAPTRGGAVPKQLLEGFRGRLMVDGYEGYNAVCEANALERLGCWSHARRGFIEVQKTYGQGKTGKADEVLAHIQVLYRIEQEAKDKPPGERLALRQARAAPILQRLRQWIDEHKQRIAPKSLMGKAVHYLDAQWPRLVRYIEDGHSPIDTIGQRPIGRNRRRRLPGRSPEGQRPEPAIQPRTPSGPSSSGGRTGCSPPPHAAPMPPPTSTASSRPLKPTASIPTPISPACSPSSPAPPPSKKSRPSSPGPRQRPAPDSPLPAPHGGGQGVVRFALTLKAKGLPTGEPLLGSESRRAGE